MSAVEATVDPDDAPDGLDDCCIGDNTEMQCKDSGESNQDNGDAAGRHK